MSRLPGAKLAQSIISPQPSRELGIYVQSQSTGSRGESFGRCERPDRVFHERRVDGNHAVGRRSPAGIGLGACTRYRGLRGAHAACRLRGGRPRRARGEPRRLPRDSAHCGAAGAGFTDIARGTRGIARGRSRAHFADCGRRGAADGRIFLDHGRARVGRPRGVRHQADRHRRTPAGT